MASSCCSSWLILALMFFVFANFLFGNGASAANLSTTYYENSCPELLSIVEDALFPELEKEPRMGASLLRLFFHDCFVNGCDGSILLDDTANFTGEKNAILNRNSVRGFHVIDTVKSAVDKACPGIVSCADILAIVARDSVMLLGGPSWETKLGRRDSRTASQADANTYLPSPESNLTTLVSLFENFGFTVRDMVALSGAHTIGQARCTTFRARLYNDLDIDSEFAKLRKSQCPESQGSGDDNLAPLDIPTEEEFDSAYYANLVFTMGLLHSDQQLYQKQSNGSHGGGGGGGGDAGSTFTNNLVDEYIRNEASFFSDFALAMIKMGDLNPLTGSTGEIRKNCRVIN